MSFRSRIALLHDEPLIRAGLEATLRTCDDLQVLAIKPDAPGALSTLLTMDAIVADRDNGIRIARTNSRARVLIVTADESEISIRRAMEAGVRGYLLLDSTTDAIVRALQRILRGDSAVDSRAAGKMLESLKAEKLTNRELDVLHLLMRGMSNKQISAHLGISVGTTKSHMKQLLNKLNASSRTEAAAIVQRRGLLPPNRASGGWEIAPINPG